MRKRFAVEKAQQLNEQGIEQIKAERFAEAESSFRQAIEAYPEFASGWDNLGITLMHQGRYFEALLILLHAMELNPEDPNPHYDLGVLLLEHAHELGQEQFEECLRRDPRYADAALYLGIIHQSLSERDKANEYFQRVLELKPDDTRALVWLARDAYDTGDFDRAITLCQKVLDIEPSPSDPEVFMGLGNSYAALGNYERAEESFERYVVASPYDPTGHYLLACVYSMLNEIDLGIRSLEDALTLSREEVLDWAQDDPRLDNLHRDPRYSELMGEDDDWGAAGEA